VGRGTASVLAPCNGLAKFLKRDRTFSWKFRLTGFPSETVLRHSSIFFVPNLFSNIFLWKSLESKLLEITWISPKTKCDKEGSYKLLTECSSFIDIISNSNWTGWNDLRRDYEWSTIQGVGRASNSKLDKHEARGRFEMASAITPYTNCRARGPITN